MHIPADDSLWFAPQPDVWRKPPAGRVLCFAPHPDDECIGPGGLLALHRRQGDPVQVVIASDGRAGDPDGKFEAATYAERRRAETRAGLTELGVGDVVFWGLPDSCVITDSDLDLLAGLAQSAIDAFNPDLIYLPWEGEGNSDHRALFSGVFRALKRRPWAGRAFGYEIWNHLVPDVLVDVSEVIDSKERALRGFATQMAYSDILRPTLGLNAARSMIFNKGVGYGEALRRVEVP